jgi:branched-chain amino acid transport system substrate-binding protein
MRLRIHRLAAGAIAVALVVAAAAAARAEDKMIKIGALLPMSGPGSYFGAQDKQGIELALEQLNRAGVSGYKFGMGTRHHLVCRAIYRHSAC